MSTKNIILITSNDLAAAALEVLGDYELIFAGRQPTESQLITLCQQHNPLAIPVRYDKIAAAVIDAASALKAIAEHGSGIGVIDVETAITRGVIIRTTTGANAATVPEHTWVLILACAKPVIPLGHRLREGYWGRSTHRLPEPEGRTLGLVGLSIIGGRVARVVIAFGMKVPVHDLYTKTVPPECERVDKLKDPLMQADALSPHCPLTQHNRGMTNAATLAQYKPGAALMDTAHGESVDSVALAAVLKAGTLHWAALDSFHSEPLITPHTWQVIDNIVLSPHMGGISGTSYMKMGTAAAANILQVLQESARVKTTS